VEFLRRFPRAPRITYLSELLDRGKIEIDVGWIFSNPNHSVAHEAIGRNREIVGRRDAAKYAAREVIFRTVAVAKVTAELMGRGLQRVRRGLEQGNASEMSTYTNQYTVFRLQRTMPIVGIRRLLGLARLGIGQLGDQLGILEVLQHLCRTFDYQDGPFPPAHDDLLAGLERAQVEIKSRSTGPPTARVDASGFI
jgi:hypothetical protein